MGCWLRVTALVSTCVTFGLVAHAGGLSGGLGSWCVFCWAFSFTGIFLILLIEACQLKDHFQDFWVNFPVTFSSYATLLCLSASIIFPSKFLNGQQSYDVYNHLVSAEVFSCVSTLAFLVEIWIQRKESEAFMAGNGGFLLVGQTCVAGIIFHFISNPVSYKDQTAEIWCMVVYCLCFISSLIAILKIVLSNVQEPRWLTHLNLCAAILYLSATIVWPVFKFNSHYPSHIYPPESCQGDLGLCPWTILVIISVLTALNFLLYSISTYYFCTSNTDFSGASEPLLGVVRHQRNNHRPNPPNFVVVCDAETFRQIYLPTQYQ